MSMIDNPLVEDLASTDAVRALQQQLNESLQQLSLDRLKVVADFAAYLASTESEAATQELLAIPGLLERVKQSQLIPKNSYRNWRDLRADV